MAIRKIQKTLTTGISAWIPTAISRNAGGGQEIECPFSRHAVNMPSFIHVQIVFCTNFLERLNSKRQFLRDVCHRCLFHHSFILMRISNTLKYVWGMQRIVNGKVAWSEIFGDIRNFIFQHNMIILKDLQFDVQSFYKKNSRILLTKWQEELD